MKINNRKYNEDDIQNFTNQPSFAFWKHIEEFFVTTAKLMTTATENLKKIKQVIKSHKHITIEDAKTIISFFILKINNLLHGIQIIGYDFCSYNILTKLLEKFGFIVEHSKTEIFHFNRSQGVFNLPPLDLTLLGGFILWPNDL